MTTTYYPDYKPKDATKFSQMEKMFGAAETAESLKSLSLLFVFDASYDRQDILVAMGRVERERGWKLV